MRDQNLKEKALGINGGPSLCLKLAGAAGFEPATTGFGVLWWPFYPVLLSPIWYCSVAKPTRNLSVPYPSIPPYHAKYVGKLSAISPSWPRYEWRGRLVT